jgi:hypothetical protein
MSDLEAGPFQYIPAPFSPQEWRIRTIESSRVTDADMERLVPRTHWVPCTGPRGTVIFADPCRLYHRGVVPVQRDRKAAFFCYNSVEPPEPRVVPSAVRSESSFLSPGHLKPTPEGCACLQLLSDYAKFPFRPYACEAFCFWRQPGFGSRDYCMDNFQAT